MTQIKPGSDSVVATAKMNVARLDTLVRILFVSRGRSDNSCGFCGLNVGYL